MYNVYVGTCTCDSPVQSVDSRMPPLDRWQVHLVQCWQPDLQQLNATKNKYGSLANKFIRKYHKPQLYQSVHDVLVYTCTYKCIYTHAHALVNCICTHCTLCKIATEYTSHKSCSHICWSQQAPLYLWSGQRQLLRYLYTDNMHDHCLLRFRYWLNVHSMKYRQKQLPLAGLHSNTLSV